MNIDKIAASIERERLNARLDIEAFKQIGADGELDPAFVQWANSSPPYGNIYDTLVVALKKVPARTNSGGDEFITKTAVELIRVASQPPCDDMVQRARRPASAKSAKDDLCEVAKAARKLRNAIETLRQPSIAALEAVGFTKLNEVHAATAAMSFFAERATSEINPATAGGKGRWPNLPALAVAQIVAFAYQRLTGQDVTKPGQSDGLANLIAEIFAILAIEANAKAALAAIAG